MVSIFSDSPFPNSTELADIGRYIYGHLVVFSQSIPLIRVGFASAEDWV